MTIMVVAKTPKKPGTAALLALVLGGPGWFYIGWRRGLWATLLWILLLPLPGVGVVSELALGQDGSLEFAILYLSLVHAGLAWLAFRSCKKLNTEGAKRAEIPGTNAKGASSTPTDWRKKELFAEFDRAPFEPATTSPTVLSSAGKLLGGATLVHAFVLVLFLLPTRIGTDIFCSIVVWYAGVRIATASFFRNASVLERTRWRRFWIGDLMSSFFVAFFTIIGPLLVGDMPPQLRQGLEASLSSWTGVLELSAIIYVVGILGGLCNVRRWDKRDKKEIQDCFQEWRLRESAQPS